MWFSEIIAFLAAVILHELGHLAAAKLLRVPHIRTSFTASGLRFFFDYSRVSYIREALVHLGGAGMGLLFAALASLLKISPFFVGVSVVLSAVNLLPIEGFDGGGAVAALTANFCLPDTSARITKAVSAAAILLLWCAVLWVELRVAGNLSLIVFALAVLIENAR